MRYVARPDGPGQIRDLYQTSGAVPERNAAAFVAHCVAELEALIAREGADTVAAFIGEPALGTGGLVRNAGRMGAHFKAALQDAVSAHANFGEVRGEGLHCAVECVADRDSRTFFDAGQKIGPRLAAALLDRGVIARAMPQGDILGFAPPFCLTPAEAEEIATKLGEAVHDVLG